MVPELLFIIFILIMTYHWCWMRSPYVKKINKIPGPSPTLPILGNSIELIVNLDDAFKLAYNYCQRLGGIFRFWFLGEAAILISDSKYANAILKSNKYIPKGDFYSLVDDWLQLGYKFGKRLDREEHKRRRKLFGPMLQSNTLMQQFIQVMNKYSLTMCDRLSNASKDNGVNIFHKTICCAFDIIYETILGLPGTAQNDNGSAYHDALDELMDAAIRRYLTPWLRPNQCWNLSSTKTIYDKNVQILCAYSDKIIEDRRQELNKIKNEPDFKPKCLLDKSILLDDPIVDVDLRYSLIGFIFAGYDTAGTAMGWFLALMGSHPEIQEKVVDELVEVFGDSGRLPDLEDLENLKYLEMCIKETLRIFPTAPVIERKLSEEMEIGNYTIPSETSVLIYIYGIHRNPEHYPDPHKFDPERFSVENSKDRLAGTYIPFSGGDQNCIGQRFGLLEMKCIMSTVLRRYRIESVKDVHDVSFKLRILLQPKGGFNIRAYERDSHPYLRAQL